MLHIALLLSIIGLHKAALTEDNRAIVRLVLAGNLDSRERLRAGAFRAVGTRDFKSEAPGVDTNVDVKIYCVFDYDNGQLRFERQEPPVNPKMLQSGGRFLRTRECAMALTYFDPLLLR